MTAFRTVLLSTFLLAAACAKTDAGSPCHLQDANGGDLSPAPGRQYLYLGSSECQSFACLSTGNAAGAFCSQSCSGPGGGCPQGMTCTQLALDQDYLDTVKTRMTPAQYQQTFGQLGSTYYCAKTQ
jgi:hypothetical protein